jgi:hypothetical protein
MLSTDLAKYITQSQFTMNGLLCKVDCHLIKHLSLVIIMLIYLKEKLNKMSSNTTKLTLICIDFQI